MYRNRSKEDIQNIILSLNKKYINRLMQMIPNDEIEIIKEPEAKLIMMTVKDSFNTPFFLGEIIVTEITVKYQNNEQYSIIIGIEPEKAYVLASILTILDSENSELKRKISKYLSSKQEKINLIKNKEEAFIANTKVKFEGFS